MKLKKSFSAEKFILLAVNGIGLIYLIFAIYLYIGSLPKDVMDDSYMSFVYLQDEELSTMSNLKLLSNELKEEGLIKSKFAFFVKSFLVGNYYNYNDGVYELSPSMSINDIIMILSNR